MNKTEFLELKPLVESPLDIRPDLNVQVTHKLPWSGNIKGTCQISIWGNVVIITEPRDNPGVSITNAIEYIASAVAHLWFSKLNPNEITWIEHYLPLGHARPRDTWTLVKLQWTNRDGCWYAEDPQWKPLTIEEVYRLINQRAAVQMDNTSVFRGGN